jgi:hypothetical protein
MSTGARVFVTHWQPKKFDYNGLEQFGEVVMVTEDGERWSEGGSAKRMQEQLIERLANFDEDRDFVVSTGSSILTAAVFTLLGRMGVRKLQLLNFQRDIGYVPMDVDIEGAVVFYETRGQMTDHKPTGAKA